jgi:hypothetical protein
VLGDLPRGRAAEVTESDLVETERSRNTATILVRIEGKCLVEDQLAGGPGGGWTVVVSNSCLPSTTFPGGTSRGGQTSSSSTWRNVAAKASGSPV